MTKKCVVIGSGLGGLSCGCILARNGYDVTVLEQGTQAGGCLQCFKRGGTLFETGMHYIGSADEGQTLHTILRYIGVDKDLALARLSPEGYDVIALRGEHYRLANGRRQFIDTLAAHFPGSRRQLERYYDLTKRVAASSPMHSLDRGADLNLNAEYQTKSVDQVIASTVDDELLREVLAGVQPLYAGVRGRTPFTTHALITDFYEQSAFRIVGGSSRVADSMVATIGRMGGRVLLRRKAVRIVCNDERAVAVETADGECFEADLVVSAIHPTLTVGLVNSPLLRPVYRNRLASLRNTTSAFTVYLKFKPRTVRYMNHNLYYYRSATTWGCERYDDATWPKSLLYMHFCHEPDPVYAEGAEILTYMDYADLRPWWPTTVGRRGQDYEDFKRAKAEAAIAALEAEVPGLRGNVESYYTSTPLTYRDYTGVPEGAMYGVSKDVDLVSAGSVSCKTRIPNLLLTGQSITLHGMLGTLAGSLMTCSEVLTTDVIFDQMKQQA